ncbi:MAG: histidine--tRNA ligase, partial [Muribaculaceae bacterium]|nr:histidine--tRNA ligase [Muribaculaceae bacterium]
QAGIAAEIYPDAAKMKKQMSYADNRAIPFVAIVGEQELAENKLTLKNMQTGQQSLLTIDEAIASLLS